MFNWRFIFDFDYLRAEDKIIKKQPESIFSMGNLQENKVPAIVVVQAWDAELLGSDNFIGILY